MRSGRVLDEGAVHGLGAGEDAELALVVGAQVLGAEVEDSRAFDGAGFGDGFAGGGGGGG